MTANDAESQQKPEQEAERSPFEAMLEYGRERGYKLDWLQKRET